MSMGYLVRQDAPVAWRGMMVVKALQQLLHEVDWGGLDVLVLDLPPGTGDTQLTIAQQVVLDGMYSPNLDCVIFERWLDAYDGGIGVVIVSTPQDVALRDTFKGIAMFQKMNIDVSLPAVALFGLGLMMSLTFNRYWEWFKTCQRSFARNVITKPASLGLQAQERLAKSISCISWAMSRSMKESVGMQIGGNQLWLRSLGVRMRRLLG